MFRKFGEGFIWGVGLSVAIAFFLLLMMGLDYLDEKYLNPKPEYIEEIIDDFTISNQSYRLVESSREYKTGLIISGQLSSKRVSHFENVKLMADIFTEEEVYTDTCSDDHFSESGEPDVYYFKITCFSINDESQFDHFKFKLVGLNKKS